MNAVANPAPVLSIRNLRFGWPRRAWALELPALELMSGETLFLRGPSGSGKSTLLNLIAGTLRPHAGSIRLLDRDICTVSGAMRDRMRADHLGVLFQQFNLLPFLSLSDNVTLPCRFSALRRKQAAERFGSVDRAAYALLERLGLSDPALWRAPVMELSVGQQQRAAAARALIGSPAIVIADEPTSALDADARDAFLSLLFEECAAADAALLFVSHDAALAPKFDRAEALPSMLAAAREQTA